MGIHFQKGNHRMTRRTWAIAILLLPYVQALAGQEDFHGCRTAGTAKPWEIHSITKIEVQQSDTWTSLGGN
jgi:hypothetical protein